ncbi:MAG: hypothetical protein IPK32_26320 [Verrucomicrobiaceae bacterium]|nr:hypothetical protein [Verrucomicrobiaceae bacterium]
MLRALWHGLSLRAPPPRPNPQKTKSFADSWSAWCFWQQDNGYCILKVMPEGKRATPSACSAKRRVSSPARNSRRGTWEPNRDFGPQFKADELKLKRPGSLNGIPSYLGSGLIDGIGPAYKAHRRKIWPEGV